MPAERLSKPTAKEFPSWVTETPASDSWGLIAFAHDGGEQEIDVSPEEYAELKRVLAIMRGHVDGTKGARRAGSRRIWLQDPWLAYNRLGHPVAAAEGAHAE